ncbi:MAG: hypothetical protein HC837_12095 [Chloroflexaceae bacterium]|nr:hypothetical protein [Chloroflexaceae bacterium]
MLILVLILVVAISGEQILRDPIMITGRSTSKGVITQTNMVAIITILPDFALAKQGKSSYDRC